MIVTSSDRNRGIAESTGPVNLFGDVKIEGTAIVHGTVEINSAVLSRRSHQLQASHWLIKVGVIGDRLLV